MKAQQQLRCIDLFCGAGGLSLGLKRAGFAPVVAMDRDAAAAKTYSRNFPDVKVVTEDVREVNWTVFRDRIDLVAGGPPCQPFSVAGDQKAANDVRDMLPEFVRAVRDINPRAFLLENVAGLASKRHESYFLSKVQSLIELGYYVDFKVLDAADYGVPQSRKRVIILGSRERLMEFPEPTHGPGRSHRHRMARAVLNEQPPDEPNTAIVTYARSPVLRPSPFAGMLVNGGGRPINLDRPANTVPASAGGNRTQIVDLNGVLIDYHSRLMDGASPKTGRVKHVRRLSIRESARLQDFPDFFEFSGERSAQYRQIGNAVPFGLSYAVGNAIYSQL